MASPEPTPNLAEAATNHSIIKSANAFTAVEVIFLGTGASDEVPNASCLLFGQHPPCPACKSAQAQGSRDRRRQTSAILKLYQRDGNFKTILIDAGWTLSASILDVFPKHGIAKLDAVFITHEHADAVNGLPYLRGWTLHKFQPFIDVYTSPRTFEYISQYFPYLVARVDGGPQTTAFRFHQTPYNSTFDCLDGDLKVQALAVQHGGKPQNPFISTGYGFFDCKLVYMSDVNCVPDSTWEFISSISKGQQVEVFIVDCLKVQPSPGHFGLGQSLAASKRLQALRTYFTQVSDGLSHAQLEDCCSIIGQCRDEEAARPYLQALQVATESDLISSEDRKLSRIQHRQAGVTDEDVGALRGFALQEALQYGSLGVAQAEPAYDGLVVTLQVQELA